MLRHILYRPKPWLQFGLRNKNCMTERSFIILTFLFYLIKASTTSNFFILVGPQTKGQIKIYTKNLFLTSCKFIHFSVILFVNPRSIFTFSMTYQTDFVREYNITIMHHKSITCFTTFVCLKKQYTYMQNTF